MFLLPSPSWFLLVFFGEIVFLTSKNYVGACAPSCPSPCYGPGFLELRESHAVFFRGVFHHFTFSLLQKVKHDCHKWKHFPGWLQSLTKILFSLSSAEKKRKAGRASYIETFWRILRNAYRNYWPTNKFQSISAILTMCNLSIYLKSLRMTF